MKTPAAIITLVVLMIGTFSVRSRATNQKPENPPLIQALNARDYARAKSLIEKGADPNCKDKDGGTVLMWATDLGQVDLVEALLAKGAAVNAKDPGGTSALLISVQNASLPISRVLLAHGADPNIFVAKGELSPVTVAALSGNVELVRLLIEKGAKVDTPGRREDTPLIIAIRKANIPLADLLLNTGAGVNTKNKDGETPLMLAARMGQVDQLKQLVGKGADAKLADREGRTSLMYAASGGSLQCVDALLAAGANSAALDAQGRNSLMYATGPDSDGIIKSLIYKGLNVNTKDKYGCSALIRASQRGDLRAVIALLENGADVAAVDKAGRTATSRAAGLGNSAVLDALKGHGAREPRESPAYRKALLAEVLRASVARLEYSSFKFRDQVGGTCFSCHNQSMVQLALRAVKDRGFAVNRKNVDQDMALVYGEYAKCAEPFQKSLAAGKGMANDVLDQRFPGGASHIGYGLLGLASWDKPSDRATDAVARYLPLIQEKDGHWRTHCTVRNPAERSIYTETALAIFSLKNYVKQPSPIVLASIESARAWLLKSDPPTTEDKTFKLFGLSWSGLAANNPEVVKSVRALISEQQEDGGWAQEKGMPSDAYATGEVLVAIHRAGGLPASDPVYRKGVSYLLRNVEEDGSWYVRSRSVPFQGYIDTGFPYHQDQFISITASCWATIAIAEELPCKTNRTTQTSPAFKQASTMRTH